MPHNHSNNSSKPNLRWEAPRQALEKWQPSLIAAKSDDEHTINIYSQIGDYWDDSGTTAKLVSAILRKADGKDVVVNINSPGGDMFEGLAINTLLAEYDGRVTVNVIGMAASAASLVAMAGDKINVAESGFLMIHNAWTIAIGNRNDMQTVADMLEKFDKAMATLYAKKTGIAEREISKMMDAETWMNGAESVEKGFAHALLGSDDVALEDDVNNQYNAALKKVDKSLAIAGMPRSERRSLIKQLTGTPGAADEPTMPSAGNEFGVALTQLLSNLSNMENVTNARTC